MYVINTNLKGVSSCKLARDLEVTQKTAWFLGYRIRQSFSNQSDAQMLGPVEMDETCAGGLGKNNHAGKKAEGTQGRSTKVKSAVAGIKSIADKKVKVKVAKSVKCDDLYKMIKETVKDGATVYTGQNSGYSGLNKKGYKHESVNHGVGEYIKDQVHTNGMESFWFMLKRGFCRSVS